MSRTYKKNNEHNYILLKKAKAIRKTKKIRLKYKEEDFYGKESEDNTE